MVVPENSNKGLHTSGLLANQARVVLCWCRVTGAYSPDGVVCGRPASWPSDAKQARWEQAQSLQPMLRLFIWFWQNPLPARLWLACLAQANVESCCWLPQHGRETDQA